MYLHCTAVLHDSSSWSAEVLLVRCRWGLFFSAEWVLSSVEDLCRLALCGGSGCSSRPPPPPHRHGPSHSESLMGAGPDPVHTRSRAGPIIRWREGRCTGTSGGVVLLFGIMDPRARVWPRVGVCLRNMSRWRRKIRVKMSLLFLFGLLTQNRTRGFN